MSEAAIQGAMEAAGLFMDDEAKQMQYIDRQMAIMDYENDMSGARNEGHEEGVISMIKSLLSVGTPIDYIIKATGRSEADILRLAN